MLSVGELKAFEFASGAIASILAAFMLAHLVGIPSLMKPRKYQRNINLHLSPIIAKQMFLYNLSFRFRVFSTRLIQAVKAFT